MTTLFVSASNSQVDQTNRVEGQRNARLALDSLRREIRCASGIPTVSPSSITITLPAYCRGSGAPLSAALTIPASGSYTVSGVDTSAFTTTTPWTIQVGSSGPIVCTGKSPSSFTGCTGGAAGTFPPGSRVIGTTTFTWCAVGGSAPYALWRYNGTACSGTGVRKAESLASNTAFTSNRGTVVPAPTLSGAATGGTLGPGTYFYDVTAVE